MTRARNVLRSVVYEEANDSMEKAMFEVNLGNYVLIHNVLTSM